MIYLKLFWDFFRVSCFTFGGAYSAIPLIRDMVLGNGWISDEALTYMIAVSESTPGSIMVNMATYIGYHQAGFWGGLIATVGVVLPAYLIILLIMGLMKNVIQNQYVQAVLRGLKPCVSGIVLATGTYMVIHNLFASTTVIEIDRSTSLISVILIGILVIWPKVTHKKLSPIALLVFGAVLGMIIFN